MTDKWLFLMSEVKRNKVIVDMVADWEFTPCCFTVCVHIPPLLGCIFKKKTGNTQPLREVNRLVNLFVGAVKLND